MIIQKTILEPNEENIYEITGAFWPDFFLIFLNIVLPILVFFGVVYCLIKFYKLFKEMKEILKEINGNIERKSKN